MLYEFFMNLKIIMWHTLRTEKITLTAFNWAFNNILWFALTSNKQTKNNKNLRSYFTTPLVFYNARNACWWIHDDRALAYTEFLKCENERLKQQTRLNTSYYIISK